MQTLDVYINSADYIDNLVFDYVETYSFQRGKAFEDNRAIHRNEFLNLTARKKRNGQLSPEEEARLSELAKLSDTQYLKNENNEFHPSSKRKAILLADDVRVDEIKTILKIEAIDIPAWMCRPFYRDAIVFYKDRQIASVLNVCLGCQYMQTNKHHYVNADVTAYVLLKKFFIELGHEVED